MDIFATAFHILGSAFTGAGGWILIVLLGVSVAATVLAHGSGHRERKAEEQQELELLRR